MSEENESIDLEDVESLENEIKKLEEKYHSVILAEENAARKEYEEKDRKFRELKRQLDQLMEERDKAEQRWEETLKQTERFEKKIQKLKKKLEKVKKKGNPSAATEKSSEPLFKIFPKDKL